MKSLYKILFYGLVTCLIISVTQNCLLWFKIRNQEAYINKSSVELMQSNDLLAEKLTIKHEFSLSTERVIFFNLDIEEIEKLRAKHREEDMYQVDGLQRYDREKSRADLLKRNHYRSNARYLFPRSIKAKVDGLDILHVGYTKNIFQDCKYELMVDNQLQEFNLGDKYSFVRDSIKKIELRKISISDDGQTIDTIKAIKHLNKV